MGALEEIRGRLEAATPGPWKANDDGTIDGPEYAEVIYRGPVSCMSYCYGGTSVIEGDNLKPDAEFIAHAPEDMRRLLSAVEGVEKLHAGWEHDAPDPLILLLVKRTREAITSALEAKP